MAKNPRANIESGFTLIELLLVILILAIITVSVIGFLNPFAQFTKADDSQREHDLNQIRIALDTYNNDTGCYPASITFGSSLTKNNTIYMKKVPQDPQCSTDPARCYQYIPDPTSLCPQWNVLLGALRSVSSSTQGKTNCALETLNSTTPGGCLPTYYTSNGYNFCLTSGQVDCAVIAVTGQSGTPACQKVYACTGQSGSLPKGECTNVGASAATYCGPLGCFGNGCCLNNCSQ